MSKAGQIPKEPCKLQRAKCWECGHDQLECIAEIETRLTVDEGKLILSNVEGDGVEAFECANCGAEVWIDLK